MRDDLFFMIGDDITYSRHPFLFDNVDKTKMVKSTLKASIQCAWTETCKKSSKSAETFSDNLNGPFLKYV